MGEVVLVHGLWYRAWSLRVLAHRLAAAGRRVHRFSYPTRKRDLAGNAAALAGFCRRLRAGELHFVAHSLGGLVLLHMLWREAQLPPGRIVLLGTPLTGSAVASRSIALPGGAFLLGLAAETLARGHGHGFGGRQAGMVSGTRPLGIGRFTGALHGPNDGTVAVAETLHEGLADRVELPVTHTGMLMSPRVAAEAAFFLENGRFRHSG
jgi:pimeloyl-ACP methyl ester carboxylesterase